MGVLISWLLLINLLRPSVPLDLDPNLSWFAQWRAEDMASRQVLSHALPGGGDVFDVLTGTDYPYQYAGENIGQCVCSVEAMEAFFEQSSGHRWNLTDLSFHRVGLGIAHSSNHATYYVELFAD